MPTTEKPGNWTEAELYACVKIYIEMLSKEYTGVPYKKSDYLNLTLAGVLRTRTAASFEYRMQNITCFKYNRTTIYSWLQAC
jgi:5-methylcytosine-specific restriction enzyme A